MVCGGYSVLGSPVFYTLLGDEESKQMEQKLIAARRNLTNTNLTNSQDRSAYLLCLRRFMEEKGELEHVAFPSLWLARFVFFCDISPQIFRIALHLTRGKLIALAPAVLAHIYRDLTLLKRNIDKAVKLEAKIVYMLIYATASLQMVHTWAFERFPSLRQNPRIIQNFQPITTKWHKVKISNCEDVSLALDSSAESFLWRPYKDSPKFYSESDQWVCSKCFISGSRKYLESFARCLMHSELVGIDCIETYLPHRVAMQFGLDQDIPGWVDRCMKISPTAAWYIYDGPITNELLCIAAVASSSTLEPSVTSKYFDWWNQSRLGTKKDSMTMTISFSEKLSHAPPMVGSHWHSHSDQIGEFNQFDASMDKEHNKRSYIHETDFSIAHGVENLTLNENLNVVGGSKRAKVDAKREDVTDKSTEAKEGQYGDNGKEGEGMMVCAMDVPFSELESMSERLAQASPELRSPTDTDHIANSRNDKTNNVGPSQVAGDNTDISVAGGVEKLPESEILNVIGGSERAMEDTKSEDLIGKCEEGAMEGQNGEDGEGSSPCPEDTKLTDFEKLELWLISWAGRNCDS